MFNAQRTSEVIAVIAVKPIPDAFLPYEHYPNMHHHAMDIKHLKK